MEIEGHVYTVNKYYCHFLQQKQVTMKCFALALMLKRYQSYKRGMEWAKFSILGAGAFELIYVFIRYRIELDLM